MDQIELFRSGRQLRSFTSSFGLSLKETRLTSLLGYLISLSPKSFLNYCNIKADPVSVVVEGVDSKGRTDILIQTQAGNVVIEAKIDDIDPKAQALKYKATWRILITPLLRSMGHNQNPKLQYHTWDSIAAYCHKILSVRDLRIQFIAQEMLDYLGEHSMIRDESRVEVYARDINEEKTLALFLHGRMYGCDFKGNSKMKDALYLAPYFGQSIANKHPGITEGMSYIARIEHLEIAASDTDVVSAIQKRRGSQWLKKNKKLIDPVLADWPWTNVKRYFFFLGEPRLVFNPSVKKNFIQDGKGFLSRHFYTFDELFLAWGGNKVY